jgi:formylmethanofuran dehydrogenase subunit E
MSYPVYCEECLEDMHEDNFDYRFEYPVCFECVEKNNLEPDWKAQLFSI